MIFGLNKNTIPVVYGPVVPSLQLDSGVVTIFYTMEDSYFNSEDREHLVMLVDSFIIFFHPRISPHFSFSLEQRSLVWHMCCCMDWGRLW